MGYQVRNSLRQFSSLLLCSWVISTPILALLYIMLPVSPDNALFDYMAWMRINGAHYYADVAEQNWPGIIFIHELGIRLFGVHVWTYRLTDFLTLQAGCLGLFLFLKRCGFCLAPYIVLVLYPPLYISAGIWMAGQRDIVATHFLFLGTALLIVDASNSRFSNLQLITAGLIIAEAVLIRPTFLAYLPAALMLHWVLSDRTTSSRLQSLRPSVLFSVGFLALLSMVLLWSMASQNLDDWYEQTIVFNIAVYATPVLWSEMLSRLLHRTIESWHWLTLFSAVGFALWIRRRGIWSEALYVAGIGGTILLSYFIQRKGFTYHISGLLTVFAVLIAILVDELWQHSLSAKQPYKFAVNGLFLFILGVVVVGTASKLRLYQPMVSQIASGSVLQVDIGEESLVAADTHEVAEYIRNHSSPKDYIFQWGRAFHVGYLAQRRPSSRFISTPALNIISRNNNPMQSWLDELSVDLVYKKPKFVVLPSNLVKSQEGKLQSVEPPSKAFQSVLNLLSRGYKKVYGSNSLILMQAE